MNPQKSHETEATSQSKEEKKYICLFCNKVLTNEGECVLHNYGDHTTGVEQDGN